MSAVQMTNQTSGKLPLTNGQPQPIPQPQPQQQKANASNASTSKPNPPTPPPLPKPPTQPPPVLPCLDLFDQPGKEITRERYMKVGVPLYEASIKGDWDAAKAIFDVNPELVRYGITENGETALHVAASAKRSKKAEEFVENLVKSMNKEDLALQNKNHNTALYLAAMAGNVTTVKIMVEKNRELPTIAGSQQLMPLYAAALFGCDDVVAYLYAQSHNLSDDGWTHPNRGWLLEKCVENNMFDIALKIVEDRPELASNGSVLRVLARKPDAFSDTKSNLMIRCFNSVLAFVGIKVEVSEKESKALQLLKIIWNDIAKKSKREVDDILRGKPDPIKKDNKQDSEKIDKALQMLKIISDTHVKKSRPNPAPANPALANPAPANPVAQTNSIERTYSSRILFIAAEVGNTKFLIELIRQYPDLIWKVNDNNQSIFHIAVKHRHEGIYNLLYEIGSMKDLITPLKDKNDNTMLHLVGKSAKTKRLQDVSGVALQMQRELLWFKEVEGMIPPSHREKKNKDDVTPYELFTKEHKDLVLKGEEWMKGTANQCMVVAALIATIVFAAAFTVPGGYNQETGIPIFYHKVIFMIFVVADAISLFSSSASILMFLSILTSRYAERDFEKSLPRKLMLGLATLFLSIATMMIAFSVSFFILYHNDLKWIPITIAVLAGFPVILYAVLQLPLLFDVYRSTYGSRYLFKPQKQVLYYDNPKY